MNPKNFPRRKAKKRLEAVARADAYNRLSQAEKIAHMGARQSARLAKKAKS